MNKTEQFLEALEPILNHVDEGILIAEQTDLVLYYNSRFRELVSLPEESNLTSLHELKSFNIKKLILRAAIDAGEVDAASRPTGSFVEFEHTIELENSSRPIHVRSGLISMPSSSKLVRVIMVKDRTEHKQLAAVLSRGSDSGLITNDTQMLEIIARLEQIAPSQAFVLLQGESGTGKTQLARYLHQQSARSKGAYVEVNCAAIPHSLIESELFGHVKGAFTGAHQRREGRFQAANGGTLFLDEISEIPLELQAKLLRAVQDQCFEMVGSDKTIKVDVRVISATNRNLRDAVDEGHFRADLFYRLAVIPINIPPLCERPGDISLLIKQFVKQLVERGYPDKLSWNSEALSMMLDYSWPGNVRELRNAVEHGMICAKDNEITINSLPQDISSKRAFSHSTNKVITQHENNQQRDKILQALKEANGSRADAADKLGINRTTLWRRMQRFNIAETTPIK